MRQFDRYGSTKDLKLQMSPKCTLTPDTQIAQLCCSHKRIILARKIPSTCEGIPIVAMATMDAVICICAQRTLIGLLVDQSGS